MHKIPTDSARALDEIEELIDWNLQYGIPLRDTLAGIPRRISRGPVHTGTVIRKSVEGSIDVTGVNRRAYESRH